MRGKWDGTGNRNGTGERARGQLLAQGLPVDQQGAAQPSQRPPRLKPTPKRRGGSENKIGEATLPQGQQQLTEASPPRPLLSRWQARPGEIPPGNTSVNSLFEELSSLEAEPVKECGL